MAQYPSRSLRELPFNRLRSLKGVYAFNSRREKLSGAASQVLKSSSEPSPSDSSGDDVLCDAGRDGRSPCQGRALRRKGLPEHNYELKYPDDKCGGECGPAARVWRMFQDESRIFDAERAEHLGDDLDSILIFTGLFSAVVAGFLVPIFSNLAPNYAHISVVLMHEMLELQRIALFGDSAESVSTPSHSNSRMHFAPPSSAIWYIGLWTVSLALSLTTAMLAVLTKQWMHHNVSQHSGSPRDFARVRQFRLIGFERWRVPLIISLLPFLLHISLAMFFSGLVIFMLVNVSAVGWAVAGMCAVGYIFYASAIVASVADPQCPYRTPLSDIIYFIIHQLAKLVMSSRGSNPDRRPNIARTRSLQKLELEKVHSQAGELDAKALCWLYSESSNPSVHRIIIESIGGLSSRIPLARLKKIFRKTDICKKQQEMLTESLLVVSDDNIQQMPKVGLGVRVERLLRFQLRLNTELRSKITIIPEGWKSDQPPTDEQLGLMATVACTERTEPMPNGYPSAAKILFDLAPSGTTLPLPIWITILDKALKEPMMQPTTAQSREVEIFCFNVIFHSSRSANMWDSSGRADWDETLRGLNFREALSAGLFVRLQEHLPTLYPDDDTYVSQLSNGSPYSSHLRLVGIMIRHLTRTKRLPIPLRRPQRRSTLTTASRTSFHPGYRRRDVTSGRSRAMLGNINENLSHDGAYSVNDLLLTFVLLEDFHVGIFASEPGPSTADREVIASLIGELIGCALLNNARVWLPFKLAPEGFSNCEVQAADSDNMEMVEHLANIRMRVIISTSTILKHRDQSGWDLQCKGEWIVTMMRVFFDPEILCTHTEWYLRVYDMETFMVSFRHMALALQYMWMDGAERHTCDAFVNMDLLSLIRNSQLWWFDWMHILHRFVCGISICLARIPTSEPHMPTGAELDEYVIYLYKPDNLFTVCLNLSALFAMAQESDDCKSETALLRLMRMRPNDPAWPGCIERLEAFADSNASSTVRAEWDTYICARTYRMRAYTATQIQGIKARIRDRAEWLTDGLPQESDKSSAESVTTTSDSMSVSTKRSRTMDTIADLLPRLPLFSDIQRCDQDEEKCLGQD